MNLSGKVAVVTGASSGIGEATALALADEGIKVVVVARRKDRLDTLCEDIERRGGEAFAVKADILDKAACKKAIDATIKAYGQLDILVNNAGVMLLGPVTEAPLKEWENMINLNVLSLLYMTHAALPHLKKSDVGHIVNVSSVAGRVATANSAVYNASKWGVNAFTEALRQELVHAKIPVRTTLIEPGAVETELASHNRPEIQETLQKRWQGITKKLQSDDIARSIVYAVMQPAHVSVNEILVRPTTQGM